VSREGGAGKTMSRDDAIDETIAYTAIRRLQAAYADVVSRRAWSELEPLFTSACEITIDRRVGEPLVLVGAGALGEFIGSAIERFDFFEFTILNSIVDFPRHPLSALNRARGRMWMCELRQDAASGHWSNAYGVYDDQYVQGDSGWRFGARSYHSLARTGAAMDVFAFPRFEP
jgi:hypothetical protein